MVFFVLGGVYAKFSDSDYGRRERSLIGFIQEDVAGSEKPGIFDYPERSGRAGIFETRSGKFPGNR
jgi:hypothetical protein